MENPGKVIGAFLGVFVAGAVFGGFFTLRVGARWTAQSAPATVAATPPPAVTTAPAVPQKNAPAAGAQRAPLLQIPQTWQAPQLMRRYAERLDLTPEQKDRINPLFQRATDDYRRVQQNTYRETGIILQRLHQDIAKELTSEQRDKLDKWQEKQRETLQKMDTKQRDQKKGPQKKAPVPISPGPTPTPTGTAVPTATTSGGNTGD